MILVRATIDRDIGPREQWTADMREAYAVSARWQEMGWPEPELIDPARGPTPLKVPSR